MAVASPVFAWSNGGSGAPTGPVVAPVRPAGPSERRIRERGRQRELIIDIDLTERRANLESTDLQEVISRVQSQLLQLEAAQSAYARINQQTLFDLIS